ncbi:MAG: DNA polymerase IV [Pseudomonadota bacterium]|nr:DNA polymerase IV [Pseudomonadota bacterium]
MRKIIHCDCDSFYASIEMRDNPDLRDKPIAVGGRPDQRGVVATCNYAARAYGVRSAMPMSTALRHCPELIIVSTNMAKYKEESARVQAIFHEYTDLVEPLSLDEAFLDVSDCQVAQGSATLIAEQIRHRVREEIGITISAGIANNKFLAKIASDWNKPDGQKTIHPDQVATFINDLPVEKIFGVGSVTATKMHRLGLNTCADLQRLSLLELSQTFGKFGARLYDLCRGQDDRPVSTNRTRKSVSTERTYAVDIQDSAACEEELLRLFEDLQRRIARADCAAEVKSRTLKLRFDDFSTTTVSRAGQTVEIECFRELLDEAWQRKGLPIRLLGIGVQLRGSIASNQRDLQIPLFGDP